MHWPPPPRALADLIAMVIVALGYAAYYVFVLKPLPRATRRAILSTIASNVVVITLGLVIFVTTNGSDPWLRPVFGFMVLVTAVSLVLNIRRLSAQPPGS